METLSDFYGKHAETDIRPAGLDGDLFGRRVRYPWTLLVDFARLPGRRRVTWERPPGVYFERNGVVHHTGHLDGYIAVRDCLRFGEEPLPQLRSAKELTSRE